MKAETEAKVERLGRLFPSQRLLARLHAADPGSAALNMAYALELVGRVDAGALESAFRAMIDRHDVLRTVFEPDGRGGVRGRVRPRVAWAMERVDLSGYGPEDALAHASARALADARAPFRIEDGDTLRASLLTLAPERHVLLVAFHHVAADGWSLEVFGRELGIFYAAATSGVAPRIDALSSQPFDCLDRHEAWLSTDAAMKRLELWRSHHEDVDAPSVTFPNAPDDASPLPVRRFVTPLPEATTTALTALAKSLDTTFFGALLTALAVVLARWTSSAQAVIGTLVANRTTVAATRIMAPLYDGVLFVARLPAGSTARRALADVGAQWMNALEHQGVPFEDVAEAAADQLGVSASRLPAIMLQVDRHPLHAVRVAGAAVTPMHLERGPDPTARTAASCVFFVREHDGRASLTVFYKPAVLSGSTARTLAAAFTAVLEALASGGAAPIEALDLDLPPWPPVAEPEGAVDGGAEGGPAVLVRSAELCPVDALSPVLSGLEARSGARAGVAGGTPCP